MICPKCKKAIPDGSTVCGYCGNLIERQDHVNDTIESSNSIITDEEKEKDLDNSILEKAELPIKSSEMMSLQQLAKKRRPLSTLSFFIMNLIMLIPIINIFVAFAWAFGKNTNQNRQSFARAFLICFLICVLVIAAIVIAMLILGFDFNYLYSIISNGYATFSQML